MVFSRLNQLMNYYNTEKLKSLLTLGSESVFNPNVVFVHPENILIGDRSYINGGMIIAGPNSTITIGNDCMISYNVHIRTTTHNHGEVLIPFNRQGIKEASIKIGDNCWIGYGCQIMPGIIIGDNVIIGAGAVVTKNIPSNSMWGGIPAKSLR